MILTRCGRRACLGTDRETAWTVSSAWLRSSSTSWDLTSGGLRGSRMEYNPCSSAGRLVSCTCRKLRSLPCLGTRLSSRQSHECGLTRSALKSPLLWMAEYEERKGFRRFLHSPTQSLYLLLMCQPERKIISYNLSCRVTSSRLTQLTVGESQQEGSTLALQQMVFGGPLVDEANYWTIVPRSTQVFTCQLHGCVKPFPESECTIRQWFFAELRPGDLIIVCWWHRDLKLEDLFTQEVQVLLC